jgi:hypothetical protein
MRVIGMGKIALVGFLAGVLGVAMVWGARHVWMDHLALHELAVIEMGRQQQGQAGAK